MNKENTSKTLSWIIAEWITLAGILLGSFYFLHTDMQSLKTSMDQRMLSHEQRTDRLYEMFIDLLREKRG